MNDVGLRVEFAELTSYKNEQALKKIEKGAKHEKKKSPKFVIFLKLCT